MNSVTFTSGKFPNYKTESLFEKIEISEDAGSLEKNWEKNLNKAKHWTKEEDIKRIKEEYDYFRQQHKWVTINFINLNSNILDLFDELVWHILAGHAEYRNEQFTINLDNDCHVCPISPKDISQVKIHLLNKTSKYFKHIK